MGCGDSTHHLSEAQGVAHSTPQLDSPGWPGPGLRILPFCPLGAGWATLTWGWRGICTADCLIAITFEEGQGINRIRNGFINTPNERGHYVFN